jgi:predicted DCC family thiol-disulfide oxidoreductase YuxK
MSRLLLPLLLLLQVPLPLREAVYDMVAANRYSWFGRSKVCQVRRGHLNTAAACPG